MSLELMTVTEVQAEAEYNDSLHVHYLLSGFSR